MERKVLVRSDSLVNPERMDVQFQTGVYQSKSPCLMYEMFNKCPNKSECPHYHGTICKFCFQYCLPTWNQAASQAHLNLCSQNELRKKRWKATEAVKGKVNADFRKCEFFNKMKSIQIGKSAEEQKQMFYNTGLTYFYPNGKV